MLDSSCSTPQHLEQILDQLTAECMQEGFLLTTENFWEEAGGRVGFESFDVRMNDHSSLSSQPYLVEFS